MACLGDRSTKPILKRAGCNSVCRRRRTRLLVVCWSKLVTHNCFLGNLPIELDPQTFINGTSASNSTGLFSLRVLRSCLDAVFAPFCLWIWTHSKMSAIWCGLLGTRPHKVPNQLTTPTFNTIITKQKVQHHVTTPNIQNPYKS